VVAINWSPDVLLHLLDNIYSQIVKAELSNNIETLGLIDDNLAKIISVGKRLLEVCLECVTFIGVMDFMDSMDSMDSMDIMDIMDFMDAMGSMDLEREN
jgi:hypothetical protein